MFKLSRFRQEHFVQELCYSLFATATADRPYSGLGTSSRALGWDPGARPHLSANITLERQEEAGVIVSLAEVVGHKSRASKHPPVFS